MTNDEARKLADTLGLYHYDFVNSETQWKYPGGDDRGWIGTMVDLIAWLDSAEGREKIRDRVRELARGGIVSYTYRGSLSSVWGEKLGHDVHVMIPQSDIDSYRPNKPSDTESSAWLAALGFLWKGVSK